MNKSVFSVVLVILLLVVFSAGALLGISFQAQKGGSVSGISDQTIQMLSSKAISSVIVYGQVQKIEDRVVTVSFNGDSVSVKLSENAAIASFSGGQTSPEPAELSQVQSGAFVSINSKLAEGSLRGDSLILLPAR